MCVAFFFFFYLQCIICLYHINIEYKELNNIKAKYFLRKLDRKKCSENCIHRDNDKPFLNHHLYKVSIGPLDRLLSFIQKDKPPTSLDPTYLPVQDKNVVDFFLWSNFDLRHDSFPLHGLIVGKEPFLFVLLWWVYLNRKYSKLM